MNELKACPFCGYEPETRDVHNYPNGEESPAFIKCKRCNFHLFNYIEEGVIVHWNTRPFEDTLRQRITELEELLLRKVQSGIVDGKRNAELENDLPLQYAQKIDRLIKIINGMIPMWIAALAYCEHGKNSDLMRMRNYYNGRDNPLTFDEMQTIFRLRELFVIPDGNLEEK